MSCEYLKVVLEDTSVPIVYEAVTIQPLVHLFNDKYQYYFTVNSVDYTITFDGQEKWELREAVSTILISNNTNVPADACPPLTGWVPDKTIGLVNNELIAVNVHAPIGINGITVESWDTTTKTCLATKGTTYYNKIIGAVKCSNTDLLKLELIMYLLAQKDEIDALDCVYNGLHFPGSVFPTDMEAVNSNTYLKTFYDYVSRFCATCIVSTSTATAPEPIVYRVVGETGTVITLENGSDITLEYP